MHVKLSGLLLLGVLAITACQENAAPTTDQANATPSFLTAEAADEVVSPVLGAINKRLAASRSNLRLGKAEIIRDANTWDGVSGSVLIANNRVRGLPYEWVSGDPRRNGRIGVTYALDPVLTAPNHIPEAGIPTRPYTRTAANTNRRSVPESQLVTEIEAGMTAWRNQTCSDAPIAKVDVQPGTDPDLLDQAFFGQATSPNYVQPADIVQSGWLPPSFFTAFAGPSGTNIIGVAFSFTYVLNDNGTPDDPNDDPATDINGDGKADTGLVEIYYNNGFAWGPEVTDFYSIIAHETGHALSLNHFGKVFVTKKDAADGLQIVDVKYAPYALMNAVYVTGRNEIAGADNSAFCLVWSNAN